MSKASATWTPWASRNAFHCPSTPDPAYKRPGRQFRGAEYPHGGQYAPFSPRQGRRPTLSTPPTRFPNSPTQGATESHCGVGTCMLSYHCSLPCCLRYAAAVAGASESAERRELMNLILRSGGRIENRDPFRRLPAGLCVQRYPAVSRSRFKAKEWMTLHAVAASASRNSGGARRQLRD